MEGMWECSCGFKNKPSNAVCGGVGPMGCKAPRPGTNGAKSGGKGSGGCIFGGGGEAWQCAECGFRNRPQNNVCGGNGAMGCKKPRPVNPQQVALKQISQMMGIDMSQFNSMLTGMDIAQMGQVMGMAGQMAGLQAVMSGMDDPAAIMQLLSAAQGSQSANGAGEQLEAIATNAGDSLPSNASAGLGTSNASGTPIVPTPTNEMEAIFKNMPGGDEMMQMAKMMGFLPNLPRTRQEKGSGKLSMQEACKVLAAAAPPPRATPYNAYTVPCKFFMVGKCMKGSSCTFSHEMASGEASPVQAAAQSGTGAVQSGGAINDVQQLQAMFGSMPGGTEMLEMAKMMGRMQDSGNQGKGRIEDQMGFMPDTPSCKGKGAGNQSKGEPAVQPIEELPKEHACEGALVFEVALNVIVENMGEGKNNYAENSKIISRLEQLQPRAMNIVKQAFKTADWLKKFLLANPNIEDVPNGNPEPCFRLTGCF